MGVKALACSLAMAAWLGLAGTASAAPGGEAEALWHQGKEAADSGHLDQAVTLYQRALAIEPARVVVLSDLALAWAGLEKWEEARRTFEKVLTAEPGDPDALNGLGYVNYRQERMEDAIRCYRKAIAGKADPQFHLNLGLAYMAEERYGDAEAQFERTLTLAPDHYWGHNNLGYALQKEGRYDEAMSEYETAIGLAGHDLTAHLNFGSMLVDLDDYAGAGWIYREALKLDDASADSHWGFALALAHLHRYDEAELEAKVALALGASEAELHSLLCTIHELRGEYEAAIREELLAVAAEDQPAYHRHLARLYEARGQLKEAARAYEAYLKAAPEGDDAADARWRLRTLKTVFGRPL